MQTILEAIGRTPIIRLRHLPDQKGASVFVKLEYFNPTASYKDRMALSVIEEAERRGTLKKGMTVIENTAGSTGTALAMVCSAKGYAFKAVSSNAFSIEKRKSMALYGAELELLDNGDRGITADLVPRMIERVRNLSAEPGNYWTRQFENPDVLTGYTQMADEIWYQVPTRIHSFCAGVGTAGMFVGVSQQLRRKDPAIKLIPLEPASAPLLTRGITGQHTVEGIAPGFVSPLLKGFEHDGAMAIEESEARDMARALALQEGIMAGVSTGLNVAAAIRIASTLPSHVAVVTVACDSGLKYMSTSLY